MKSLWILIVTLITTCPTDCDSILHNQFNDSSLIMEGLLLKLYQEQESKFQKKEKKQGRKDNLKKIMSSEIFLKC